MDSNHLKPCEVFDVVSVESVGKYGSYEENGPTESGQLPRNTRLTTDQRYTQLCGGDWCTPHHPYAINTA